MTTIRCNKCGKSRTLSQANEQKLLAKFGNDLEKLKNGYVCRDCKKKDREKQ